MPDSFDIVALVAALQKEFGISIHLSKLDAAYEVMDVNFFSAAQILKVLVTKKINSKNLQSVVLISSQDSLRGLKGNSLCSATKGAIDAFARSMAMELAPNVRVNVINAGLIKTPLIDIYSQNEGLLDNALDAEYPLKRLGKPEEVAGLIKFLMSDKGAWITGQNIVIDGGLSARTI